jgi:anti-sigma regulatory factor (Ser/Thr protein kinase)
VSAIAQLSQWGRGHLADDTAAIVAELVANAVAASMPAGTPVGFGMILTDSSVVVEVFDRAPGEPAPGTTTPEAESGRGLHLVAALSCQWGWTLLRGSKVVWAEVAA